MTTKNRLVTVDRLSLNTPNVPSERSIPGLITRTVRFLSVVLTIFFLSVTRTSAQTSAQSEVVGGGFINAGILGNYYSDTSFSTLQFTRNDVRLDFGTSNVVPPGGSPSAGYSAVGATNWSASWTGQFIPRFNETYTFRYFTSGTLSVAINGGTPFINQTSATSSPVSTAYTSAFTAGVKYTITVKYSHATGPWGMFLHWSSPSTPEEAIEPLAMGMIEPVTYQTVVYADQAKTDQSGWQPISSGEPNIAGYVAQDTTTGWPQADCQHYFWEGETNKAGVYELQFTGQAVVGSVFDYGTFSVGGTSLGYSAPAGTALGYDSVSGEGYNSSTNTTRLKYTATNSSIGVLSFKYTKRLPTDPNVTESGTSWGTGVTNVQLMKPVTPGSTTGSLPFNTLFTPYFKQACQNTFTAMRWLTANGNEEVEFSQSTPPFYFNQDPGNGSNSHWESEIELCNETGKDLYITIPVKASTNNLASIVNLLHYGADATYTPYTTAQASPVYPPLNPNLAVYVEWSNEVWNYGGGFTAIGDLETMCSADAGGTGSSADWAIINYDGAGTSNPSGLWTRLEALRIVQASNAFRASFGDAAMGTHVRLVMEDQYGNSFNMPQFLDHYFNKTDPRSTYTGAAHPVSYYIWGGGGATYYTANNPGGTQTTTLVPNSSFEAPVITPGTTATTITNWTTTTGGGLYSAAPKLNALTPTPSPSSGGTAVASTSYGYEFTTGSTPVAIYSLGRWVFSGNNGTHSVRLFDSSGNQLYSVVLNVSQGTPGQFDYGVVSPPVVLAAHTTYYLVSDESVGGDSFAPGTTSLSTTSDLTINAPVSALRSGNTFTFTTGTAGSTGYGPVDMKYTTNSLGLNFPPDPTQGSQAVYFTGTSSVSTTVNFAASGTYAIAFDAAWGPFSYTGSLDQADPLQFFVDGVEVTPNVNPDLYNIVGAPYTSIGFGVNVSTFNSRTTNAITLTAGNHVIKIQAAGTPATVQYAFLDNITIDSVDSIYAGGIPSTNYAAGLNSESNWPKAYGVHRIAYEGGWALGAQPQVGGGDRNTPLSHWAEWSDPRAEATSQTILNDYAQSGGDIDGFGTYETWSIPDTANASSYPGVLGIVDANNALRAEPTNGTTVPNTLKPFAIAYADQGNTSGTISATDGFISWNILVPLSGTYSFHLDSSGGTPVLLADDATTVAQDGSVFLTKGLHSAKVRSNSGSITVSDLIVTQTGGPGTPTITGISLGSGSAAITWSAVSGAAGYLVSWGTASGVYTTTVDAGSTLNYNLTGLANNVSYYVVVRAYDSSGRRSLPSVEKSFISLVDGVLGTLADWNFTGNTGAEVTVPVTSSTMRLTIGDISRGNGYIPDTQLSYGQNHFGDLPAKTAPASNTYATTLAGAMSWNQYNQFTITPNAGTQVSLSALSFAVYFQTWNANLGPPERCSVGVEYSIDGSTFTPATVTGGGSNNATYNVDFTGVTALQNVNPSTTITLRICLFGGSAYSSSDITGPVVTGMLATLTPPTITTPPTSQMISAGSSVTFNVAASGLPTPTYQWQKNGVNISGATSSSYTISSAASGDAATYTVIATNSLGSASSSGAVLDVLPNDPQTASNLIGTTAALSGLNIGSGFGGSSVHMSGNWWIDGSGTGGINGSSDGFHFEQKSVSGDFQMYVNLQALYDFGGTSSRAGLMIRDGTAAGSNFLALAGTTSSSGGYKLISRTTVNAASTETTTSGTGMTYTYPAAWMMIERTGTELHAFVSSDNDTYTEVTPPTGIAWSGMSSALDIGVFCSSGTTSDARAIMNGFAIDLAPTSNGPLLSWDFTNTFTTTSDPGYKGAEATATTSQVSIGMEPSIISRGPDSPANNQQYSGEWGTGAINTNYDVWYQTTLAGAKTKGSYFQFAVQTVPGAQVSLNSLAICAYQQSTLSPSTIVVEYSTDGFATEDGISVGTINPVHGTWIGSVTTLNLSTVTALQNVASSTILTFRIWGYAFNAWNDKGLGVNPVTGPDVILNGIAQ